MKKSFLSILLVILVVLTSISVLAESDVPIGLQKIIDYNNQSTAEFAVKVSFLIAFIAGMLGILSPCILPFLPAYFSYTFKEKKDITKMTLIFFLGFSLVFVSMGIVAGFIGAQVLSVVQSGWLVTLAGIFIVILGIMSLLGKGFSSLIKPNKKFKNDASGTFLFGIFFALGWTACLGPILAGILGIGAIMGNIFYSALLLFFYSLGNLVPLFIISIFYDKFHLERSKFIRGRMFNFGLFGKEFKIHSTNLISGFIFILFGIVIVIYQGTSVFNKWDIFGTKALFYSVQDTLINWQYANYLGFLLLILFVFGVGWFLWKRRKKSKKPINFYFK